MNINNQNTKKERLKSILRNMIIIFAIILVIGYFIPAAPEAEYGDYTRPEPVMYSTYEEDLKNNKIDKVYIDDETLQIRYTLLTDETAKMSIDERNEVLDTEKYWKITDYPGDEDTFRHEVVAADTQLVIRSWSNSISPTVIITIIELSLTIGLFLMMFRMLSKKGMSSMLGVNSTGFADKSGDEEVHFSDIIGHDEAIADIKQTLKLMFDASNDTKLDVKPPKGILLIGPPGTGKTMIAKACATEAGMNFKYVNSSQCIDKFVGQGASAIRNTFKEARKCAPCILFFDEIDSIGSNRGDKLGGGADMEYKQTLNALLQELDGFSTDSKVFVMAATNMYESLDPALVRPGRFDRKITITPPRDVQTRVDLLKHYLSTATLNSNVNLEVIARQLTGMTGADISQICNEAKLIAIQNNDTEIKQKYLEEAMDKTFFKGNRTKNVVEKDRQIVAHHEGGHALSMLLNNLPIARISIIPNTSGIGGMVVTSETDSMFATKTQYLAKIKSLYAGRIAEELIYGKDAITTGACNDIEVATQAIDEYLNKYAFGEEDSLLFRDKKNSYFGQVSSGYTDETYDKMQALAQQLYEESKKELTENIDILKALAARLLERETMDKEEVEEFFKAEKARQVKKHNIVESLKDKDYTDAEIEQLDDKELEIEELRQMVRSLTTEVEDLRKQDKGIKGLIKRAISKK